jgi:hypothetical protein
VADTIPDCAALQPHGVDFPVQSHRSSRGAAMCTAKGPQGGHFSVQMAQGRRIADTIPDCAALWPPGVDFAVQSRLRPGADA